MAVDEGMAQLLRDELADYGPRIVEKRMFGGLCLMRDGHMVCGLVREGGLMRVGKDNMDAALALPGVGPMTMGDRTMGGFVVMDEEALADDALRGRLLDMALTFTATLPPK